MNNKDFLNKYKSNNKGKDICNPKKNIIKARLTKYLTNQSKNINSQIIHSKNFSKSNLEISSPCKTKNKSKFKINIGFLNSLFTETVSYKKIIKKEFSNIKKFKSKFNIIKPKSNKNLYFKNDNYSIPNGSDSNRISNKTERLNNKIVLIKKRNMSKNENIFKYNFSNLLSNISLSNLKTYENTETCNTNYNKNKTKKIFKKINPIPISEYKRIFKGKINKLNKKLLNSKQLDTIQSQNITGRNNYEKLNKLKTISRNHIIESFCYYKLYFNNSVPFNPINNNINELGYNEGFISIDNTKKYLRIKDKNDLQKNNCLNSNNNNNSFNTLNYSDSESIISLKNKAIYNNLNIDLKTIRNIYIDNLMKDIIIIHNIFLKNSHNGIIKENSLNINKILNDREIIKIKNLEQNEKIKAGLCNFFSFIIELNNSLKIEFILINYFHFNIWFNYLQNFINNSNKLSCLIQNGNNSYLNENKKN